MSERKHWFCMGFLAAMYLMRGRFQDYEELRDEYLALSE